MSVPSYDQKEIWPGYLRPPISPFSAGRIAFWLFVFATAAFLTSGILSSSIERHRFNIATQQITDPIVLHGYDTILNISVQQDVAMKTWSFPEIAVLDEDGEYLMSFGKEFYAEEGRDSDGYWSERVSYYDVSFVIPTPGTYRFQAVIDGDQAPAVLRIKDQFASEVPHRFAAVIALLVAVVLSFVAGIIEIDFDFDFD